MIPERDLEVLQSFDGRGSITLSVYLPLDTPQRRDFAYETFTEQVKTRLSECGSNPSCREALQEDVDIVGLYLKTNGHRRTAGLAIFSCAAELFWRAYPLSVAPPAEVAVGPKFNVAPLK